MSYAASAACACASGAASAGGRITIAGHTIGAPPSARSRGEHGGLPLRSRDDHADAFERPGTRGGGESG
jgi:hypothetical protein